MSQMEQQSIRVRVRREKEYRDLPLPSYATSGSAGMDICAAVPTDRPVTIRPGERAMISTGLTIALPVGFEAQIRARSGLASRYGIGMVNGPGTIDADYRGVIHVLLVNWGDAPFIVRRGDRIAQLIVAPVVRTEWAETEELDGTVRGEGGFGSTGAG